MLHFFAGALVGFVAGVIGAVLVLRWTGRELSEMMGWNV